MGGSHVGEEKRARLYVVLNITGWFIFNISVGTVTKWTYLHGEICVGPAGDICQTYAFPYMITIIHMLFSWAMCWMYIFRVQGGHMGATLNFSQQLRKIMPMALCFALAVGMGNLSLKYIYPSFNQMLGAMTPLITVLLSVLCTTKRYNAWTWVSMPVLCGGLMICSVKEVNFNLFGTICLCIAIVLRAAKTIIQARLLSSAEKIDSVSLLYYMAPWAAVVLAGMSLFTEGTDPWFYLLQMPTAKGGIRLMMLLAFGGLNACLLNLTGFLVTAQTSDVMLQVLGNVKNCLNIAVSIAVFRNEIQVAQVFGVIVCLAGVWLYQRKGGTVKPGAEVKKVDSSQRAGGQASEKYLQTSPRRDSPVRERHTAPS
eukprot:gnl/TRDRNA2_/TRDRNA2_133428_c0_seq1.p1 gnl/TRDRNA2_/TRDRNA2_133428_c0~~gnl/TRDRNA2_/TRDRNA2_133428_c0_seq1.p1  ORF type:complete len:370 (+),score=56.38 gnl/TRDRNA2_/TRDRNA2_133428_c0_seq1:54-1163(+)